MDLIGAPIWMVPLTASLLYVAARWLLNDEPDISYECIAGAAATCFKGETSNMIGTIFLGVFFIGSLIYGGYRVALHLRWRRQRQHASGG